VLAENPVRGCLGTLGLAQRAGSLSWCNPFGTGTAMSLPRLGLAGWGPLPFGILCPIPWCGRARLKSSTYYLNTHTIERTCHGYAWSDARVSVPLVLAEISVRGCPGGTPGLA